MAAAKLFGLSKIEQAVPNEVPNRGSGSVVPPTDPLIDRFYELVLVNGPGWKELIQEEFGAVAAFAPRRFAVLEPMAPRDRLNPGETCPVERNKRKTGRAESRAIPQGGTWESCSKSKVFGLISRRRRV